VHKILLGFFLLAGLLSKNISVAVGIRQTDAWGGN